MLGGDYWNVLALLSPTEPPAGAQFPTLYNTAPVLDTG